MSLLFACAGVPPEPWVEAISGELPDIVIRVWPEYGAPEEVEYALLWGDLVHEMGRFPNLKALLSFGAGVDHILKAPEIPASLPIVRLGDPAMQTGMAEYVLYNVLRFHRRFHDYEGQQRRALWIEHAQRLPERRRIGLMGLGTLGLACAQALTALGFDVLGWSRSKKTIDTVRCFYGPDGLKPFLNQSEILVCLLPLTVETESILNHDLFAALPMGSFLINAGRGAHLVEEDLLAALENGRIAGAALDVFRTEPLPKDHPFWSHPKIAVTPHVAALVNIPTATAAIADTIRRIRTGQELIDLAERSRGY